MILSINKVIWNAGNFLIEQEVEEDHIIGHGTWLDRVAKEVVERETKLGRDTSNIRVEMGLGASGIPHIGNVSDAARAFGVKMALEEAGHVSELIAYSDDMDALRKVPAGLPEWLSAEIGKPVSEIKDPFSSCHESYGAHMSALLKESLDLLGITYSFRSGYEAYKSGLLVKQIELILANAERIGEKIEELTGQKKYLESLPYFPQCANCGRLNVARPYKYDPKEKRVFYRCTGDEIGKKWIEGCGHEGSSDITKGEGKLSWKVEFAARWAALDIRFEAHGKELTDSVKINDWISENILSYPPPHHVVYELFQDKSGKKLSKSTGNLVSPQKWLDVASPQSLLLVYYKRIVGARSISEEDIPQFMDEYDSLEKVYFGKVKEENKMKEARLKGLYYYVNLRKPSTAPAQHVPYGLLVQLAGVAPEGNPVEYIAKRLMDYRVAKKIDDNLRKRIEYALRWAKEFSLAESGIKLDEKERKTLSDFASQLKLIKDPEAIQTLIFDVARAHGMEPSAFFKIIYKALIGMERGPRLGPYITDIGMAQVAEKLSRIATA
ncbi:MAG: lysine--tRNA ligase [Nitrososphaerales archaeon]